VSVDTTCPHCGETFQAKQHSRHISVCLHRAEVREAAAVVMADPARPGYARGKVEYEAVRATYNKRPAWVAGGYKAPSYTIIVEHFGSWGAAVNAFGLKLSTDVPPRNPVRGASTRKRPAVDTQCPHCGNMYTSAGAVRHIALCPMRPDVMGTVRRLAESDIPGVAVQGVEYDQRATAANKAQPNSAPTYAALRVRYDTWEGIVKSVGLITYDEWQDREVDREREEAREAAALMWEMNRGLAVCRVRPLRGGGVAYELR
jgi:predicted RNA-binding Zn-ribbon protein involved in translation (DUF1610 family)